MKKPRRILTRNAQRIKKGDGAPKNIILDQQYPDAISKNTIEEQQAILDYNNSLFGNLKR